MPRERKSTQQARAAASGGVREVTVRVPTPLPHQQEVLDSPARWKVVIAGRRYGKTLLSLIACVAGHGGPGRPLKGAVHGGNIWWVAPTFGQASDVWRELKWSLQGAWVDKSETERRILLPGGGAVTVKSSDNPDLLRGAGLDGLVLDEAALCVPETWGQALRPALADRKGWALLVSTPKGQNWLWEVFEQAATLPDWQRWQAPTSGNPRIDPAEIEALRATMGAQEYMQEVEAQFVREGGSVFRRQWFRYWRDDPALAERVLAEPEGERRVPHGAGTCFLTVDLAVSTRTSADYTVMAVWQLTPEQDLLLVDLLRDRIQGPDQLPLLRQLCQRYPVSWAAVEDVGYQKALIQDAQRAGLPVRAVRPDRDKVARANLAAGRYRSGKVYHRQGAEWLQALEGELLAFPDGKHDDQVDACSLAALEAASSWSGLHQYYAEAKARSRKAG